MAAAGTLASGLISVGLIVQKTTLYGLLGLTHGSARILTVLSDSADIEWFDALGVSATEFHIVKGVDHVHPVQLHERIDGSIGRLIRQHGVRVLSNSEWMTMKQRLKDTAS